MYNKIEKSLVKYLRIHKFSLKANRSYCRRGLIAMVVIGFLLTTTVYAQIIGMGSQSVNSLYCGPDCMYVLSKLLDKDVSYEEILSEMNVTEKGVSANDLILFMKTHFGINTGAYKLTINDFYSYFSFPVIAQVDPPMSNEEMKHWVIVLKAEPEKIVLLDPPYGVSSYTPEDFNGFWSGFVILPKIKTRYYVAYGWLLIGIVFVLGIGYLTIVKGRKTAT